MNIASALESLPIAVMLLDRRGGIFAANKNVAQIFRKPLSQIVGRNVSELLPDSHTSILSSLSGRGAAGAIHAPELGGAYVLAQPLKGKPEGCAVSILDYGALGGFFSSAPSMAFINQVFRQVLGATEDGLIIVDSRGFLVFLNGVAAAALGVTLRQLNGLHLADVRDAGLADLGVAFEALTNKRRVSAISECPKAGRSVFLTGYPVYSPDGSPSLVLITLRDLTGAPGEGRSEAWERGLLSSLRKDVSSLVASGDSLPELFARGAEMRRAVEIAKRFVRSQCRHILVLGEPGTGKSAMARFIHLCSQRAAEPFLRLNCAHLGERDIESALFGCEAGAFGSRPAQAVAGALEVVGRGTLYLENIQELPFPFQLRLQTFLARREYRRVGGQALRKSRVTVILASSRDLGELVEKRLFLPELSEMLAPYSVVVPPLRSRREDILDIARDELARLNRCYGADKHLDPLAEEILLGHHFPGNVRELRNAVHQAALFCGTPNIGSFLKIYLSPGAELRPFAPRVAAHGGWPPPWEAGGAAGLDAHLGNGGGLPAALDEMERKLLLEAAASCRSTREMAAMLGVSQAGISRKLKKFSIGAPGKIVKHN
jgi:transcriptional regulator with PAS, ATPase and Fis domain